MTGPRPRGGFTLIELMIVVTIIGVLAAIAIPKFADLVTKSQEAATKGSVGALRSSLAVYYSDMEGQYPVTIYALTSNTKYMYIDAIPYTKLPGYHPDSSVENTGTSISVLTDAGGWAYVNVATDDNFGTLWVNCSSTDSKGTNWTTY